jgi:hypothetical protein
MSSAAFSPIDVTKVARAINNIYLVLKPWQDAEWANAGVVKWYGAKIYKSFLRALLTFK